MPPLIEFSDCARLAGSGDNVAIATRRIEAGSRVALPIGECRMPHTVLLGHRFAVVPIVERSHLLSWGRPFGRVIRSMVPGEMACNAEILKALAIRSLDASLPDEPNFESEIVPYVLNEGDFRPSPPVEQVGLPAHFLGHQRTGGRGVGTRNFIVLLGTSSLTGSFVRQLANRLKPLVDSHTSIDGIVPVAHTEGGESVEPNNRTEVLRTLAGFIVHPNVGAVLVVDRGSEPINNEAVRAYLARDGYPLDHVRHCFLTVAGSYAEALAEGESRVRTWLPEVAASTRVSVPLSGLSVALQCGGSDAFSGISGNPLVGAVGHEVIRHGGRVCLTETDELIGAEEHILEKVDDLETARRFLSAIDRFKERLSWHGATAEGNPSGGNQLRGLTNITLKSLGAAAKKSPLTRLDRVGAYAERLTEPGFVFMDGPGSDLEGIAGQVAAGCNLILFVTGNGSVTNFPFVPTLKVTTTTARHELLENEMDVNAGRFLDGESMDDLRDETFELVRSVASGTRTRGERAGHSQVMIWRNWRQTGATAGPGSTPSTQPDGRPLRRGVAGPDDANTTSLCGRRWSWDRVGLILPVSMCASEIARLAAERLNRSGLAGRSGIDRFVALTHTEGCGSAGAALYRQLPRTYRGYLTHPAVAAALVLEHGCEKIPNDVLRKSLADAGVDREQFGWASVQLDGGMEKVLDRIEDWFSRRPAGDRALERQLIGPAGLDLGLLSDGEPSTVMAEAFGRLADRVLRAGGSVLVPLDDPLLAAADFRSRVLGETAIRPTLAYGEPMGTPGLHIVDTETRHWVENLTGLGACGAGLILGAVANHAESGHPLLPVFLVADSRSGGSLADDEIDLFLSDAPGETDRCLLELIEGIGARLRKPRNWTRGITDFQITRGRFGVTS